jgi:hypothetical protein
VDRRRLGIAFNAAPAARPAAGLVLDEVEALGWIRGPAGGRAGARPGRGVSSNGTGNWNKPLTSPLSEECW